LNFSKFAEDTSTENAFIKNGYSRNEESRKSKVFVINAVQLTVTKDEKCTKIHSYACTMHAM
jgi:hypothetical protein